jgi:hypothetical protein
MRRPLFAAVVAMLLTLPVRASAVDATPEERAFFARHTGDLVRIDPQRLDDAAVDAVFSRPIYRIKLIMWADAEATVTLTVLRAANTFVSFHAPSQDGDQSAFQKLLKPGLKLRSETDANTLQQALDVVFPYDTPPERAQRSFRRAGNAWMFIRYQFMGGAKKSGFVFETDAAGAIKSVRYVTALP